MSPTKDEASNGNAAAADSNGTNSNNNNKDPTKKLLVKAVMDSARTRAKKAHASLGVVRLDYDYPPAPGDIDSPDSFGYDVFYRAVPGLTFAMCQSGKLTDKVQAEFIEAVQWLDKEKGVSAITGDCGFMMWFQDLARQHTHKPVLMSSLVQLPSVCAAYSKTEDIAIFTANSKTLAPMNSLIEEQCGVNPEDTRFQIVGCQDVPGFEAVEVGGKVDVPKVTPGIVALAKEVLEKNSSIRAILLECTELPPYADALRHATGLPVYDAITCCNMFIEGLIDNPRFGINDWQEEWDGAQDDYQLGKNLDEEDKKALESA
jgi:Asp/Glu/hydantoin racemase